MVYARRQKTWVNIKWGKIKRVENKMLKVEKFNFMNSNLQRKKVFYLKKVQKDCKQQSSKKVSVFNLHWKCENINAEKVLFMPMSSCSVFMSLVRLGHHDG